MKGAGTAGGCEFRPDTPPIDEHIVCTLAHPTALHNNQNLTTSGPCIAMPPSTSSTGPNTDQAGLPSVMKTILHDMDEGEVQGLRDLICGMPDILRAGLQLRTFAEIEADLKQLSEKDSRVEALGKELERLSALKDENQAVANKLAQRLETQQEIEEVAQAFIGLFSQTAADYVVNLSQKLTGFREAKEIANARVSEISEDIARVQAEVDNGRVDPEALAKAKAEFDELETLRRG